MLTAADYFEWVANVGSATTWGGGHFSAFPLTGMQGPTGGAPGPVVGDFWATYSAGNYGPPTTAAVFQFPTVTVGNSGAYYNPATGRYRPPAGRYLISAGMHWVYASGTPTAQLWLYKNGTAIRYSYVQVSTTNYWGPTIINEMVDANGTDYFEIWVSCATTAGGAQIVAGLNWFGATPTQGMVGPPGPAGGLWQCDGGRFSSVDGAGVADSFLYGHRVGHQSCHHWKFG